MVWLFPLDICWKVSSQCDRYKYWQTVGQSSMIICHSMHGPRLPTDTVLLRPVAEAQMSSGSAPEGTRTWTMDSLQWLLYFKSHIEMPVKNLLQKHSQNWEAPLVPVEAKSEASQESPELVSYSILASPTKAVTHDSNHMSSSKNCVPWKVTRTRPQDVLWVQTSCQCAQDAGYDIKGD